jgi:hypothetical protein
MQDPDFKVTFDQPGRTAGQLDNPIEDMSVLPVLPDPSEILRTGFDPRKSSLDETLSEEPQDLPFETIWSDELMDEPDQEWVIPSLGHRGDVMMIYGRGGSLKSFSALCLMMKLYLGEPWLGHFGPSKPFTALYFTDESLGNFPSRIRAAFEEYGASRFLLARPPKGHKPWIPQFGSKKARAKTMKRIQTLGKMVRKGLHEPFDILIIDPLVHTISKSKPAFRAKDLERAVRYCKWMAEELDVLVVLIHHSTKDETKYQGTAGMLDDCESVIRFTKTKGREIFIEKAKEMEAGGSFRFRAKSVEGSSVIEVGPYRPPEAADLEEWDDDELLASPKGDLASQIKELLADDPSQAWTYKEIAKNLEVSVKTVTRHLKALIEGKDYTKLRARRLDKSVQIQGGIDD